MILQINKKLSDSPNNHCQNKCRIEIIGIRTLVQVPQIKSESKKSQVKSPGIIICFVCYFYWPRIILTSETTSEMSMLLSLLMSAA